MKKKSLNAKKQVLKRFQFFQNNPKILKIYKHFKKNIPIKKSNFIAGISGGPDSMALAFFLKCYSLENNIYIKYIHVDHKLRKNSSKEANIVKTNLSSIGINLKINKWNGKKPKSNIQAIARKNRYKLLLSGSKLKKKKLFLAHTKDYLIENLFLRLIRGSGLEGISSFNSTKVSYENFDICRPLIDIKKEELIYVSSKIFKFYIQDPSNKDSIFKRVRVRKIISDLVQEGFDMNKLNITLKNLKSSNTAIKYYVNKNIINNCKINKKQNLAILNESFFNQPLEIKFRSLTKIIKQMSDKYYSPRGKKLTRVLNEIDGEKFKKLTISGCVIENLGKLVILYPENEKNS